MKKLITFLLLLFLLPQRVQARRSRRERPRGGRIRPTGRRRHFRARRVRQDDRRRQKGPAFLLADRDPKHAHRRFRRRVGHAVFAAGDGAAGGAAARGAGAFRLQGARKRRRAAARFGAVGHPVHGAENAVRDDAAGVFEPLGLSDEFPAGDGVAVHDDGQHRDRGGGHVDDAAVQHRRRRAGPNGSCSRSCRSASRCRWSRRCRTASRCNRSSRW